MNIHLMVVRELEVITQESSYELRRFVDVILKNIRALYNLVFGRNNLCDILFATIIFDKLDKEMRNQFEFINTSEVPSFDNLIEFFFKEANRRKHK